MANTLRIVSPVDGSIVAERPSADASGIEAALVIGERVQRDWKQTPLDERKALCSRFVEILVGQADEIAEELAWQMGRPIRYGALEITRGFQERARYMIDIAEESLADIAGRELDGSDLFVQRAPLGVVFVLSPWNYPYLTCVNALLPALLAGNSVILKMSAQTLLCAERMARAMLEAGAPEGLFQVLHLSHDGVRDVIADPRIQFVAFTGSVEGGAQIQEAASGRFIATGLELGGKDPAYVRADADLADAIENLVDGAFFNSGQSCCAVERIYVHRDVYRDFVDGFVELTSRYVLGSPIDRATTLGPMVRPRAADFVREQIARAVSAGAAAAIPPDAFEEPADAPQYLAPQVLTEVDHGMDIMREETFGPAVGIMGVDDDAMAVALMNDSRYGLSASVWTQDAVAANAIGAEVETGTFYMNRCDYLDPSLAWTGVKDSGRGCTLSRLGFDCFTRPKSFHFRMPK